MTYLAVPIAAKDLQEAKNQIRAAVAAGAELLELRTDYLEGLSTESVRVMISEVRGADSSLPIIVTCRDRKQGGVKDHPIELRIRVLLDAVRADADYVDFEYENFVPTENQEKIRVALARGTKTRLILSAHNFESRFDNIGKLYRDVAGICPGAIPKLVYTANHINDCFEALDLLHRTGGERIVLCMGQAGLIVRLIPAKLGSLVTFASIDDEKATAPGQLTVGQFKSLYRAGDIGGETQLFGVIADPVGHSLSPAIHNACFAEAGLDCLYLPLLVQGGRPEFELFMRNVISRKWLGFRGFSITIPHKHSALEFTRSQNGYVEPLAEKIGAVNTLIITADAKPKAYNTDYAGALDAVTENMGISRRQLHSVPVAVVGAGGVSRAIVAGLADAGAKITVYNRTFTRAEALAGEFDCQARPLDDLAGLDAKLLVNCTSIGMHPDVDRSPVPQESLNSDMTVFDTVYNPVKTLLLKQAEAAGARTIDGVSMFVNQAMAQFKLFTGHDGNAKLMRETVLECLA
jgi:3-dehydroquinate dehydratase/shikimate dehydrogenase